MSRAPDDRAPEHIQVDQQEYIKRLDALLASNGRHFNVGATPIKLLRV